VSPCHFPGSPPLPYGGEFSLLGVGCDFSPWEFFLFSSPPAPSAEEGAGAHCKRYRSHPFFSPSVQFPSPMPNAVSLSSGEGSSFLMTGFFLFFLSCSLAEDDCRFFFLLFPQKHRRPFLLSSCPYSPCNVDAPAIFPEGTMLIASFPPTIGAADRRRLPPFSFSQRNQVHLCSDPV